MELISHDTMSRRSEICDASLNTGKPSVTCGEPCMECKACKILYFCNKCKIKTILNIGEIPGIFTTICVKCCVEDKTVIERYNKFLQRLCRKKCN